MRHRKKGKKIGRTSSHRRRTLQALSNALIENKRITTTVAKAKALRPFVEPLITRAKEDTQHNRRQVFRYLQNNDAVQELFGEVSERVGDRPGGYTRIVRLGQRSGDGAELAMIELVDYNDVPPADSGRGGSGKTRRGSGKGRRDTSEKSEPEPTEKAPAAEADEASADTESSEESVPAGEEAEAEETVEEADDATDSSESTSEDKEK